ncbi:hypothetical protein [Arenibacter echinorum]|uniref:hypothetical protein n=1 Tax=Arenibacter echinorum TaxID=440515 RepID=UPI000DB917EF|nr:hypothetical protein [Arenibacter echinorum]
MDLTWANLEPLEFLGRNPISEIDHRITLGAISGGYVTNATLNTAYHYQLIKKPRKTILERINYYWF